MIDQILPSDQIDDGILKSCALHGIGGSGKSTLAKAVCRDPRIKNAFPDGILWAELGLAPNHLSNITEILRALGDFGPPPISLSEATERLRAQLYGRSVFVVLDDVWHITDVTAYAVLTKSSTLLITTRLADVADGLHTRAEPLSEMKPDEAIKLFEAWTKKKIDNTKLRKEALALAEATGFLPLALELAGAVVARGIDWIAARRLFLVELAGARKVSDLASQMQTVLACLNLSLTRARVEDDKAWRCFAWLGVLARGAELRADICSMLWRMPEESASNMLMFLAQRAIVQPSSGGFRLHDLMHELARTLLHFEKPFGLKIDRVYAHSQFLRSFGENTESHAWDRVNISYIHAHLIWHLSQAHATSKIAALLSRSTSDGRHFWEGVLRGRHLSERLTEDISLAYDDARRKEGGFQNLIQYTLMLNSVRGVERRLSIPIVEVLLRHGVMSASHCLAWARARSSVEESAAALVMVARTCSASTLPTDRSLIEQLYVSAWDKMMQIEDVVNQCRLAIGFVKLANNGGDSAMGIVLSTILRVSGQQPEDAAILMSTIPANLQASVIQHVLQKLSDQSAKIDCAQAFCRKAARLPLPQRGIWVGCLLSWLKIACDQENAGSGSRALSPLSKIFTSLVNLVDDENQGLMQEVGKRLATRHVKSEMNKLLGQGTYAERAIANALKMDSSALIDIVLDLQSELSASKLEDVLISLEARWLPQLEAKKSANPPDLGFKNVLAEAARVASAFPSGRMMHIASRVAAIAETVTTRDDISLAALLPHLSKGERDNIIDGLVARFSQLDRRAQESVYVAIQAFVKSDLLAGLLARLKIDDSEEQIQFVFRVAAEVNESNILDGLAADVKNSARIRMLARMMRDLTGEIDSGTLKEFIDVAAAFASEWWIVEALSVVSLKISDSVGLVKLIDAAIHIDQDDLRARLIGRVISRLGLIGDRAQVLAQSQKITLTQEGTRIIANLVIEFAQSRQFDLARELATTMGDHPERWRSTAHLALHIGTIDMSAARLLAQEIQSEEWRTWATNRLKDAPMKPGILLSGAQRAVSREVETGAVIGPFRLRSNKGSADAQPWKKLVSFLESEAWPWSSKTWEFVWNPPDGPSQSVLAAIGHLSRPAALRALSELAPLASICGCTHDLEGSATAMDRVVSWWP